MPVMSSLSQSLSQSPGRRAWRRFKANRLGFISLLVFTVLVVLSLFAEVLSNDKPLIVRYQGQTYLPLLRLPGNHVWRRLSHAHRLP